MSILGFGEVETISGLFREAEVRDHEEGGGNRLYTVSPQHLLETVPEPS